MKRNSVLIIALAGILCLGVITHNHVLRTMSEMGGNSPEYKELARQVRALPDGNIDSASEDQKMALALAARDAQQSEPLFSTTILLSLYRKSHDTTGYSDALVQGLNSIQGSDLFFFMGHAGRLASVEDSALLTEAAKTKLAQCWVSLNTSAFKMNPEFGFWLDAYRQTYGFDRFACER